MTAALKVVPKPPDESVTHGTVVPLRPYDVPDITARQFLEAIMRSPNIALSSRMRAADMLLKCNGPPERINIINDEGPVVRYIIPPIPS